MEDIKNQSLEQSQGFDRTPRASQAQGFDRTRTATLLREHCVGPPGSPFTEYRGSATGRPFSGYEGIGAAARSPVTDYPYSSSAPESHHTGYRGPASGRSRYGGCAAGCPSPRYGESAPRRPRTRNDGAQRGTKGTAVEHRETSGPCPLSATSGKLQEAGDDCLTA